VFFLTGLTLALSGAMTGGFALVLGLSCALMIGRLSAVFALVPAALIAFGFLFQEFNVMVGFNAAAYALPAFAAFAIGARISFVRSTARIRGPKVHPVSLRQTGTEPQAAPEADVVIRPDFAHPSAPERAQAPAAARRVVGDPVPLPDFLRIPLEPEPPRRNVRKRLFARHG
jgi:hypothetical protein